MRVSPVTDRNGNQLLALDFVDESVVNARHSETGVTAGSLSFEARALFSLKSPDRLEYAAVYSAQLDALPELRINEEASAFLWWSPDAAGERNPGENMSALDAAIAVRVAG